MAQNIYDDPEFLAGYSRLPRSVSGLEAAPEWPSLRALLPDLAGLRVVDLGCGFGWFARWANEAGARSVLATDISERMLERAEAENGGDAITYERRDLEELELPQGAFDLAYSSLALHYVERVPELLRAVYDALASGGRFVFSVEHPIFMAPSAPAFTKVGGREVWPLNGYLDEGPRVTNWFADGVVKRHRTIGRWVTELLAAGFKLTYLEEWGPTAEQVAEHPEWASERERPMFLLISATRDEIRRNSTSA